jgi:biofilm PGA synthesis N-glycosyltransferase PgaC
VKISAYVPCYNARATIREAVQSIVDQSVPISEIFVVDDCSTDGSGDHAGVPVIRLNTNAGRGAARAKAMLRAEFELVLACDASVTLDRRFLEFALPWFKNERVAAVFGWVKDVAGRTAANRWRARHLFGSHLVHKVTHSASFATTCSVVRKSTVQHVGGFNAALRGGEDADLGRRLLGDGFDVVFDPNLFSTTFASNSSSEVLERYARWNSLERMSLHNYMRQISYALKVMVPIDIKAKDPLAAVISLLAPHYQFCWSRVHFSLTARHDKMLESSLSSE